MVRCDDCAESSLVAFSCKTRGWCPSCGARRAHETALHLDEVLPRVGFRQWTLSVPFALRFLLVKEPKLLRKLERRLVEAVFRWQRRRAKEVGATGRRVGGAVFFTQLFGSALQLQPHLHGLVAEGVWNDGVFMELPPPSPEEVEGVLERALAQLLPDFLGARGGVAGRRVRGAAGEVRPAAAPPGRRRGTRAPRPARGEDGLLTARRHRRHGERPGGTAAPFEVWRSGPGGRVAVVAARGRPVRVRDEARRHPGAHREPTGEAAHRAHRAQAPSPDELHGVLAPAAATRSTLAPPPLGDRPRSTPAPRETKAKRPPIDWAHLLHRTWACDVFKCPCGGQRRVVALVTAQRRRTTGHSVGHFKTR